MGVQSQDYKEPVSIRAAAILTNSYVSGTVIGPVEKFNQLLLFVTFTLGSLTSLELKIEFSNDNSTWFQEVTEAVSGATITNNLAERTTTVTGNRLIPIAVKAPYIKVSAKGTGTVTSSSLTIDAAVAIS